MACLATGLPWCVAGLALGTPELTAAGAALAGFAVLTALADDAGCGAGLATIGQLLSSRLPGWHSASGAVFGGLGVLVAGLALFVAGSLLAGLVLDRLAWGLRWSLWLTGRTPPEGRVAAGAVGGGRERADLAGRPGGGPARNRRDRGRGHARGDRGRGGRLGRRAGALAVPGRAAPGAPVRG